MGDTLGDRMKANYENRTRTYLPRRTYTIIRVDGKAFHTYTRKIKASKPFCHTLNQRMDDTARYLCENIQGAQFAYTQSDEISILVTDFESAKTDSWFDGNIQKICSVSASIATVGFNRPDQPPAMFDSRVFVVPDPVEVLNYFYWRYKDWVRNSVSMLARAHFSNKELHGVNTSGMHEMLHKKGVNWANLDERLKNGSLCNRNTEGKWEVKAAPKFKEELEKWKALVPNHGY